MSKVIYLSGWKPQLCIQLDTAEGDRVDFNRLLFTGIPSTLALQNGGQFYDACREQFVLKLKEQFEEKIEEGGSHVSLRFLFLETLRYLKWSDEQNESAFTQCSLESYMSYLNTKVIRGEHKSSNYKRIRSAMVTLFTKYLDLPHRYFNNIVIRDSSDSEPFEAYSRSDLNQLLPFLRSLFKQTHQQFVENPEKHINTANSEITMMFQWQGQQYWLAAGVTKMMCAATFLLAYYTYANTSDLFKLKQSNNASTKPGEIWYTMPAFKRRAFKTINIEMGGHELEIPKYALDFFDKLLSASKLILDYDGNAALLQTVSSNKVRPLNSRTLQSFIKVWLEKHFSFTDQTGRRLRPVISRFRETGAQLTTYHQGELANDIMLNNTPNTRKKHYSVGNKITNNGMMQDALSIREEQIKNNVNTKEAQQILGIRVLVIEEEYKISLPQLSRTPNGGSCKTPFGEKSERYTRKARQQGLIKEGERLACADLLACFGCPEQVIVQSVSDIWCLLSFKACIEESLYLHLDVAHYRKNFEKTIRFIEEKILPFINKIILKKAQLKLDDEGYHPAWDDSASILNLLPKTVL
ncbi:hypothetical protein C3737_21320 [Aeromonas jandaei]|uniref:hypothetical protein n=1 Tax=Aeromonas jandaei TaxID=650 RepID=UPI000CE19266|nr:hypothetical protein [Aeromonas jandaei]PPA28061.1 hypothetical protein C3737_21320 [Aeromonas jandaei]